MKKFSIRALLIVLLVAVAVTCLPLRALAAMNDPATNLSASISGTSHSFGAAYSGSSSSGTATMKVSALSSAMNGTLTLKNYGSDDAVLYFNYSTSGTVNSLTIDGNAVSASGFYNDKLAAGAELKIYLAVKGWKEATVTLTDISLTVASAAKLTVSHNGVGTVSVGGVETASGSTVEVPAAGTTLKANPAKGASFVGWINAADNSLYSTAASLTYVPTGDLSLKALFASADTNALFWGSGKNYLFESLSAAITHASGASVKVVTLAASGTLPGGNYSIPAGVTLVMPYDSAGTWYAETPGCDESNWSKPSAFYTLTMKNGANIIVNGAISVSAKVTAKMGYSGNPTSKYGHVAMEKGSTITVNNGANLYAWGYITGSGNVTIKSGGTVYEAFQVTDWRGGTYTTQMIDNSNKVFPMTQYYIQNVEAPMTLESGAEEKCCLSAVISKVLQQKTVPFIGQSGHMFNITSGSVTKRYDGSTDRLILDVNGTFSVGSITITMAPAIPIILPNGCIIKSENYVLPVNSNVTLNINGGSTVTLNQTVSFLPGVQANIAEGATLKVGSGKQLFVYDASEWVGKNFVYYPTGLTDFAPVPYAHGRSYTRTTAADIVDTKIKVNGTLDASEGKLYTTAGGSNIYSTGKGLVKLSAADSSQKLYETTQTSDSPAYAEIPITAAQLKNGNGDYVATEAGDYVYDADHDKWALTAHTVTEGVTPPTCTEGGYTTHTCVCGYTYTDSETKAGHTAVSAANPNGDPVASATPATCTDAGVEFDYWKCTREGCGVYYKVENDTQIAVEENAWVIPALGHTKIHKEAVAHTCVADGNFEYWYCETCSKYFKDEACTTEYAENEWIDGSVGHSYGAATYDWAEDYSSCTVSVTCDECAENTENKTLSTTDSDLAPNTIPGTCQTEAKTTYTASVELNGTTYTQSKTVTGTKDTNNHTNVVTDAAVAATCTATGLTEGKHCSVCGEIIVAQTEVAAKGHTNGNAVIENNVDATCTADGSYDTVVYCTVCNAELSREKITVDAKGHTEVIDAAKEATCTATGLTEGKHCSVCNEVLVAQTEAPALGHTEETISGKAATCTEAGLTDGVKCSACGEILTAQEEIPALGHNHTSEVTTAPTCTTAGVETFTCGSCGDTYTEVIEATDTHEYTNGFCDGCDGYEPAKLNGDVYEISNAGQLYWFAKKVNDGEPALDAKLMNDISVNEGFIILNENGEFTFNWSMQTRYFNPIQLYTGTFDGCGYQISGLRIGGNGPNGMGFIIELNGGTVQNLSIVESYISNSDFGPTGAIIGNNNRGLIKKCVSRASVSGYRSIGGIVGTNSGTVADCLNQYTVYGKNFSNSSQTILSSTGGIAGYSTGAITNCKNTGSISGDEKVGGIVGQIWGCTISECENSGNITLRTSNYAGGIVGYCKGVVTKCHNSGTLTIGEDGLMDLGGIAGYVAKNNNESITVRISDCFNTGTIDANSTGSLSNLSASYVGGIAGNLQGSVTIENCYHTGNVSGHIWVGAIVGAPYSAATISNCCYLEQSARNGYNRVQNGIGYSTVSSTQADTDGQTMVMTADQFTSGEVAYLLNADRAELVWFQTCGEGYPAFSGLTVYQNQTSGCTDETYTFEYANEPKDAITSHKEEILAAAAPDCINTGLTEGKHCSVCGEVLVEQEVVAALGHTNGNAVIENNVDATCTADGSYDTVVYCTVCNAEVSRVETTVSTNGHTEGKVVVENNVAPNCENTGSYDNVIRCTVCGEEISRETVTVDALGHTEVSHEAKAPTCTEIGWDAYVTCSRCDYTTYVGKAALDHDFAEELSYDENGHWYACTRTNCTEKNGVENHDWDHACDTDCNDGCGYTRTITHSYTEASEEVEIEANCVTNAVYKAKCAICGDVSDTERITGTTDATKHTGKTDVRGAKDATCVAMGYTGDTHCSDCNELLTKGTAIEMLTTHTYPDTWTQTKAPTCTEKGSEYRKCTVEGCESTETRDIALVAHTTSYTAAKDATCAETGNHEYWYCSVCKGYFKNEQGTEAYAENAWVIETTEHIFETTYTTDGQYHWLKCTNSECDEVNGKAAHSHGDKWKYDETNHWHECACGDKADLAEHGWDAGVVTTQPTTSATGVMTYTCGTCGVTRTETIDKLTGTTVYFVNYTAGANRAEVTVNGATVEYKQKEAVSATLGADGAFTVTCAKSCVVAYTTDGVSYTKITGTKTNGVNSFTIADPVENMTIAVLYTGDVNKDGSLTSADAALALRYAVELEVLDNLQKLVSEVNADGSITSADAAKILRVVVELDLGF